MSSAWNNSEQGKGKRKGEKTRRRAMMQRQHLDWSCTHGWSSTNAIAHMQSPTCALLGAAQMKTFSLAAYYSLDQALVKFERKSDVPSSSRQNWHSYAHPPRNCFAPHGDWRHFCRQVKYLAVTPCRLPARAPPAQPAHTKHPI